MRRTNVILAALVLFALGWIFFGAASNRATREPRPEHDWAGACVVAENFVEDRLKAPSTAEFSHCSPSTARHLGDGEYSVTGTVDAENSFGALLRSEYAVKVQHVSGNRWQLIEIGIMP